MTRACITGSVSRDIAEFAVRVRSDGVPDSLRRQMLLHAIDTVAVGIAGSQASVSRRVFAGTSTVNGRANDGRAPIWLSPVWGDASTCAFVNGVSAHALELDDTNGCDHSGAVVVPALLAESFAEGSRHSTDEFLSAMVVGYEVARRTQNALGGYKAVNDRGWHSTAICGPFGSASATGVLMGFTTDQFVAALGIASSTCAGTWSFSTGGGDNKALHAGMASRSGLQSALLAKAGVQGSIDAFADVWGGVLNLYGGVGSDVAQLTHGLGHEWHAATASIKLYPTCASSHPAIAALESFYTNNSGFEFPNSGRIEVRVSDTVFRMCGEGDLDRLGSLASKQLSIPYALALIVLRGRLELSELVSPTLESEMVRRVLNRISVRADKNIKNATGHGYVNILAFGKSVVLDTQMGDPTTTFPANEYSVLRKIEDLGRYVGQEDRFDRLIQVYKSEPNNVPEVMQGIVSNK